MAGRPAFATLGAVLVLVPACRDVLGVKGYGTRAESAETGADEGCPAVTDAGDACTTCVDSRCCEQASTCDQEAACRAMKLCVAACNGPGDNQCRALCNQSIPRTPEWGDLVACEANQCKKCPGSRIIRAGSACDECLARFCGTKLDAISKDAIAIRLDGCRRDCPASGDADARAASGCSCTAFAHGTRVLDDVDECQKAHCNDRCNPPVDWSCLGHVQSPDPDAHQLELHVGVVDASNSLTPVKSFDVAACAAIDWMTCDRPLDMNMGNNMGHNGWATLTIPKSAQQPTSFFTHLLVTTGNVDALFYFFPPVRRSPFWSERRLVNRQFAEKTVEPLGIPIDWVNKGGIVWSVTSCGDPSPFAKGVVVSAVSLGGTPAPTYYFDAQGSFVLGGETSQLGIGAVINVNPAVWVLTAKTTIADAEVTIGTYPVHVIAGKLTHVTMAPL